MLEREGIVMNPKKLRRLYAEEGLAVKRRRARKRATGERAPMAPASAPNDRWSLDFLSPKDGRRGRTRTGKPLKAGAFEAPVSTNSTTRPESDCNIAATPQHDPATSRRIGFQSDVVEPGRRFRILAVIDDCTHGGATLA